MKSLKRLSMVVATALVAGCATTFRPWNLSEVKPGMDRGQVVGVLGDPDRSEVQGETEYLHYFYSESTHPSPPIDTPTSYDANRKLDDERIQRSLMEYHYVVKLFNGKVESYKEIK